MGSTPGKSRRLTWRSSFGANSFVNVCSAKTRPATWLEMTAVYGDLGQDARFAGAFERHLNRLWAVGTKQTLTEYLA